ncbi:hypothetical protein Tco_1183230 [Tanacetum coccineum]
MVPRVLKMDSQHQDLEADRQCATLPAHHMPDRQRPTWVPGLLRSAVYNMARTPYARSPSTFTQKGITSSYGHEEALTSSLSA